MGEPIPGEHAATVRGLRNLTKGYSYSYACDYYLREHGLNLIDEYERLAERATELERERDAAVRVAEEHAEAAMQAEQENAERDQLERERNETYDKGWEAGRREWLDLRDEYARVLERVEQAETREQQLREALRIAPTHPTPEGRAIIAAALARREAGDE